MVELGVMRLRDAVMGLGMRAVELGVVGLRGAVVRLGGRVVGLVMMGLRGAVVRLGARAVELGVMTGLKDALMGLRVVGLGDAVVGQWN